MSLRTALSSLLSRLQNNRFFRRLLTLSAGTAIGQALMVAVTPFLTRLFTPAEFGIFAVFTSLFGMLGMIMCLRYELAIPVAEDEEEAASLVVLGFLGALGLSLLLLLAVHSGGSWLALRTGDPQLAHLLYLLPATLFLGGLALPLNFWSIRLGTFRTNAFNRILQYGTQASGQLVFGLASFGSVGLALGYSLGHLTRVTHFLFTLPSSERRLLRRTSLADIRRTALRHWRYPVFSTFSALFQSGSQLLPAILVAMIYGPAIAGWFALGQRIMGFPVLMIGETASAVFLKEIADLRGQALYRMFTKTVIRFLVVALVIMLPVAFIAPHVFAFIFGEPWREAGIIVRILVPLYIVRLTAVSVAQTLNVLRRQDLHLLSSVMNFLALAGAFSAGWMYGLAANTTFLLYSLGSMSAFAVYLGLAWWMTRRHALAGDEPST